MATTFQRQAHKGADGTGRTRIMVDVSPDLRRRIKLAAAQRDLTIREYVVHILDEAVPQAPALPSAERRKMTREDAAALFQLSSELASAHPDTPLVDSTEIIRQMRDERTEQLGNL